MTTLGLSTDQLQNAGADNTVREIGQQPAVWRDVAAMVSAHADEVTGFLRPLLGREDLRIILTGAGTSAFAGEILAPALSRHLGRRIDAVATTDIVSNPGEYLAEDKPTLLVSFARSGNSPESTAAIELADQRLSECYHLVLTCNPDGQLNRDRRDAKGSLVLLMPDAANDQGFAMTSSFTAMVLTAWLTLAGIEPDGIVERLAAAAEQVLSERADDIHGLAGRGFERVVYLGSGPLKGLARESALKLLELTAGGIVTQFDSPMGFRHGPKAMLDDQTLVVVYLSGDPHTRQYDMDMLNELQDSAQPGSVIGIAATGSDVSSSASAPRVMARDVWALEGLAGLDDAAIALPFVLVAQLLALHLSLALGRTPDNPFPGNEVNRVVQGVTIHRSQQPNP